MGWKSRPLHSDHATGAHLLLVLMAVLADSPLPRWLLSGLLLKPLGAERFSNAAADNLSHAAIAWAVIKACRPAAATARQRSLFCWARWRRIQHQHLRPPLVSWPSAASLAVACSTAEELAGWCLGSLLDLDHFLAAGSLDLRAATHLPSRPLGHAVPVAVAGAIAAALALRSRRWGAIVGAAFASHQLRDATRRGLWFCVPCGGDAEARPPWGVDYSTPPLPYPLYLSLLILLPSAVGHLSSGRVRGGGGSDDHDDGDVQRGQERGVQQEGAMQGGVVVAAVALQLPDLPV